MAEQPLRELMADKLARDDLAPTYSIWFDGACEPRNPGGVATCGWIVKDADHVILRSGCQEVRRGDGATNNVAEWCALGLALRWMLDDGRFAKSVIRIYGDSRLVVEQLGGNWRCNKEHLQKLRDRCLALLDQMGVVWKAQWIPREENEEADELSRRAYEESTGKKFPERNRQ